MNYKLYHGDCIEWMSKLPDNSVDFILTDPPYGTIACKWDNVIPFEPMWAEIWRVLRSSGVCTLFAGQPFTSVLIASQLGNFKYNWIWDKGQGTGFLNAKKQPLRCWEDVCVFYKNQPVYNPQMREGFKPYKASKGGPTDNYKKDSKKSICTESDGSRYPLNKLEVLRDKNKFHPTQKPVALLEYFIKTYTREGEVVLDFTMGSGSTGVACMNTGRKFLGIERDDKYFEIAQKRIEEAVNERN